MNESVEPQAKRVNAYLRFLPLGIAIMLIVLLAIVQGRWADRWTESGADAEQLAERLQHVPMTLGQWEGKDLPVDQRELRAAGSVGHISRVYRNPQGENVSLYIICGHMRDVSVHTPDRCYPASGFDQLNSPTRYTLLTGGGESIEFFTTTFRKDSAEGTVNQRVFWTWSNDGKWAAPEWPRQAYGGVRALYKLYLISTVRDGGDTAAESPCLEFGKVLMPRLTQVLFAVRDGLPEPAAEHLDRKRPTAKQAAQLAIGTWTGEFL